MIGCADHNIELDETDTAKSFWDDQDSDSYYNDYDQYDDQDQRADSSESLWGESSASESDELIATHHSSSATLGGYCAPGCIWSAYAVNTGAKSAQATCNGQSCACVVDGDIYSSCNASSNSGSSSTPGSDSSSSSSAPSNGYNASIGNRIADEAYYIATRRNTVGYCYNAAADAIEAVVGRFLWGSSAYMAADQLAAHPRFFEVSVSDLPSLPAGAVVVWGRGNSAHGHISIALGDGREASDHVASQMTYHYGGGRARVFYPN